MPREFYYKFPITDITSDQAKILATWYRDIQIQVIKGKYKKPKKPKFQKNSLQNYEYILQSLLDQKCGGDMELLQRIILFGANSLVYRGKVSRGPHALRKSWKSVRANFDAAQAAARAARAATDAAEAVIPPKE